MPENNLPVVELLDDFYRDSFNKVVLIIVSIGIAIVFLITMALYIYLHKPAPKYFPVGDEWRIKAPVPVDQPYLSNPEVLQWVSDTVSKIFTLDFNNYNAQLQKYMPYFTQDGWQNFLNQLNIYANYNKVQTGRMFIYVVPTGAPVIINDSSSGSLSSGRYAW